MVLCSREYLVRYMPKKRRKTVKKKSKYAGKTIAQLKSMRKKHKSTTKAYSRISSAISAKRRK